MASLVIVCSFAVSAVLVLSCGQTDRQTEPVASHTDVDDRFAHATTVDVITETAAVFLLLAVHLTGGLFLSTNNILRVELQKFV